MNTNNYIDPFDAYPNCCKDCLKETKEEFCSPGCKKNYWLRLMKYVYPTKEDI